jgi:hypothetical protein
MAKIPAAASASQRDRVSFFMLILLEVGGTAASQSGAAREFRRIRDQRYQNHSSQSHRTKVLVRPAGNDPPYVASLTQILSEPPAIVIRLENQLKQLRLRAESFPNKPKPHGDIPSFAGVFSLTN